jgi:S-adenosylmethionine synthetase
MKHREPAAESVSEIHPDKMANQISDAILDAYIAEAKMLVSPLVDECRKLLLRRGKLMFASAASCQMTI